MANVSHHSYPLSRGLHEPRTRTQPRACTPARLGAEHRLRAVALACIGALASGAVLAQAADTSTAEPATVITVTGRSSGNTAGVAGFGDTPLARLPLSATVITTEQLRDAGIAGLGDITRLDAGTTDAYNAPGYWGQVAVRGYTLDNRSNYRRDGLPVNAETVLATANKTAIELLKGTSGMQAGISSPGGLLNLVVKRPVSHVRAVLAEWVQPGTATLGADLGERSADGRFGWRVNAAASRLDPAQRASRGDAALAAVALEWQPGGRTRVELEGEWSRQSQPSTPGMSLLGSNLPDANAHDPRVNLNNQTWSLPVVMSGVTASVRVTHDLGDALSIVAHAMQQRLVSDDRIAFPFGCSAADDYSRFCADGRFDLYDYRSEDERRTATAADVSLQGRTTAFGVEHRYTLGVLTTQQRGRFHRQAYNWVGIGRIDASVQLPPDPTLTDENTQRDDRSVEWHLQDQVVLGADWSLWGGLRVTRLERSSVRTDGSRPTSYRQNLATPWFAISHTIRPGLLAYGSWGEGVETEVAPNRPDRFINAGEPLPAMKSRQFELGLKATSDAFDARVAVFDIDRPLAATIDRRRVIDGSARHRGIELEAEWRAGAFSLRGSAMALEARRRGSATEALNGLRPENVPARSLKVQAAYNVAAVPGLALLAFGTHEGQRAVLPDNSVSTPGWTRWDIAARWAQRIGGQRVVWRVGVDNVANARAWKEAPYQYDHAWLYPLAPRTVHASANWRF